MPNDRQRHACGKVVNGEGEVEVVLAGGLSDRAGIENGLDILLVYERKCSNSTSRRNIGHF